VPALVLGAGDDRLVDTEALEELASAFRSNGDGKGAQQPVLMRSVAHDCMLDTRWEEVAERILAFLETL